MKKIIESLRNKPDHVKTRYVIVFSAIATVIVVGLWVVTLRFTKTTDDTIKTDSPFKVFGQLFGGAVSDTKQTYQEQKKSLDINIQEAGSADTSSALDTSVIPQNTQPETPVNVQ